MTTARTTFETGALRTDRAAGFTLIELMITVVIVAILLAVAIPLYQHQMRESRRTDARTALLDLASREERYYATQNQYTSTASDLGYSGWGSGYPVGNGYYYITSPTVSNSSNPPSFSFTALPVTGMGQDEDSDCASFTITSTGAETATGSDPSVCWGQ
jgi:type IV pilus assembly protein PilE